MYSCIVRLVCRKQVYFNKDEAIQKGFETGIYKKRNNTLAMNYFGVLIDEC